MPNSNKRQHPALAVSAVLLVIVAIVVIYFLLRGDDSEAPRHPDRPPVNPTDQVEDPSQRSGPRNAQSESWDAPAAELFNEVPRPLTIVTQDIDQIRLSDIRIYVESADAWKQVGVTNHEGLCTAAARPSAGSIVASGPGYQIARAPIAEHDRVLLTLEEGASIGGRVVFPDGSGAGAGIKVLAREHSHLRAKTKAIKHAFAGFPSVIHASTDSFGSFILEGLNPDCQYRIFAGGSGVMMKRPVGELVHAFFQSEVEIEVCKAYGACVVLTEEDGSPLEARGALVAPGVSPFKVANPTGARRVPTGGNFFDLACDFQLNPDRYEIPLVYEECTGSRPSSVDVTVHIPYYRPLTLAVPVSPITNRTLSEIEVPLRRTDQAELATLEIGTQLSPALERAVAESEWLPEIPLGYLAFAPVGGNVEFYVALHVGARVQSEVVPLGVYEVLFVSHEHLVYRLFEAVEVSQSRSVLRVDLSALAGVLVSVNDVTEGSAGFASVLMRPNGVVPPDVAHALPRGLGSRPKGFAVGTEFLLAGVIGGDYSIGARVELQDDNRVASSLGSREVNVEPGQVAHIEFEWN